MGLDRCGAAVKWVGLDRCGAAVKWVGLDRCGATMKWAGLRAVSSLTMVKVAAPSGWFVHQMPLYTFLCSCESVHQSLTACMVDHL